MKNERDACFYMANLGSEVSRAILFRDSGEIDEMKRALQRAQGIVERVLALEEMRSREAEILVLKNLLSSLGSLNQRQSEHLKDYFYTFARRVLV